MRMIACITINSKLRSVGNGAIYSRFQNKCIAPSSAGMNAT